MNNINIYAHKSGPLSKAFLKVVGLTDAKLVEVTDQTCADMVLLTGTDDLRALYNKEQIFCVLQTSGQRVATNQPENVCLIDTRMLFDGDKGIQLLLAQIDKLKATKTESVASNVELPKFSDVPTFDKSYLVLVIDDQEQNLRIAEAVLGKHSVVVARSFQDAMLKLGENYFDAVLTDMDMPPDKYYSSLNLDHYAVDEKIQYGFAVVLEMTRRGMPVAVVTDGNHHEGWVSAMFDRIKGTIVNGKKVLFFNNIGKRWDKALKCLMEEEPLPS
ncbi:MAG: response regulator [Candidatus Taylorbacteria bacterium]|nr:response regulator [Candidatus Taylorbacteria bacterium]